MTLQLTSLAIMSVLYVFAGSMHFLKPKMYLKIMPPWLPAHFPLVYASGVAEILLGMALWVPALRIYAAWGIIALLIAVFPANIYMFQRGEAEFGVSNGILLARLPLQGLLIAWAFWHTRFTTLS